MAVSNFLPGGLWPVMLTPFTPANYVDVAALQRLTDFYLDAGANGLFTNCLSGEMYQLTEDERLLVARTVVEQAGNRAPVVATGSFSRDVNTDSMFIRKLYDTGVQAVILITGMLVEPDESEDVLKARLSVIVDRTGDIPLGVYECPVPYKRLLSADLMRWLADTGRFVYHKDTSCHAGAIDRKARAVADSSFGFYNADTTTALCSLDAGGRGISPIAANFYPELYVRLLDFYRAQNHPDELQRLHAMLTMMDRVTHSFYPFSAKWFLRERGLSIETATRLPTETLTSVDRMRLDALMVSFRTLAQQYDVPLVL